MLNRCPFSPRTSFRGRQYVPYVVLDFKYRVVSYLYWLFQDKYLVTIFFFLFCGGWGREVLAFQVIEGSLPLFIISVFLSVEHANAL